MEQSFAYSTRVKGLQPEFSYPYEGVDKSCRFNPNIRRNLTYGFAYINGDEENLKRALARIGPLAVSMNSNLETYYGYSSGVYDDEECTPDLTHAVCLVG
jgi:C1A family cysteine protease